METDTFWTLKEPASVETRVKGSRFIGYAAPAGSDLQAKTVIENTGRKFHDATHHCYAYQLGLGDSTVFRYNDAGEPAGTAGKPIYECIRKHDLTDVVCVVTRYFGGTKLGTGGLARAYSGCADAVFKAGIRIQKCLTLPLILVFAYAHTGPVMTIIDRYHADITGTFYGPETKLEIQVRRSLKDIMKKELINQTAGKIDIQSRDREQ